MKVSRERRPDIIEVLTKGIYKVFADMGMKFVSDDPDLEIRYAFGLASTKKLKLKPIQNESDAIVDIKPDDDGTATLLVSIRDLKTKQDVWRVNASRPVSGPLLTQDEVNRELAAILSDFPPDG